MDATASGARSVAGRESLEWVLREQRLRADDTTLTASSHGLDGERTPAAEGLSEDVRGRRSRVVLAPEAGVKPCGAVHPTG